jgi:hypothetical protein
MYETSLNFLKKNVHFEIFKLGLSRQLCLYIFMKLEQNFWQDGYTGCKVLIPHDTHFQMFWALHKEPSKISHTFGAMYAKNLCLILVRQPLDNHGILCSQQHAFRELWAESETLRTWEAATLRKRGIRSGRGRVSPSESRNKINSCILLWIRVSNTNLVSISMFTHANISSWILQTVWGLKEWLEGPDVHWCTSSCRSRVLDGAAAKEGVCLALLEWKRESLNTDGLALRAEQLLKCKNYIVE